MKKIVLSLLLLFSSVTWAEVRTNWSEFALRMKRDQIREEKKGWSYVISGSIGFFGGFAGQQIAKDPFEKGAYTAFQSIGIAAIGFGLYQVYVGSEEQKFFTILDRSDLTDLQKEKMYLDYKQHSKELAIYENRVRALTHGLIAALNINSARQQSAGVVRDSLYFIGGVNLLACASYSFDF